MLQKANDAIIYHSYMSEYRVRKTRHGQTHFSASAGFPVHTTKAKRNESVSKDKLKCAGVQNNTCKVYALLCTIQF